MRTGSQGGTNSVLVGASIVVAVVVGVFLSYNANHGLPFVKTFELKAHVPDAAELVAGSEVRIGGFRVGQVKTITAKPPTGDRPPYAELDLQLDGTVTGIPANTVVRVRPRSLLGAKYVELTPGPAGGRELGTGSTLPLSNARSTPELDEAFNVFDQDTRNALRSTIRQFGNGVAGRGADINRSIGALGRLMPPLQRIASLLAEPQTDIDGFVRGAARFTGTLAPLSGKLGSLIDNGAKTLQAVDRAGSAVERTLELIPPAEDVSTRALRRATPLLRDATAIAVQLGPGTKLLPRSATRLAAALRAGTPVLRRAGELTRPLDAALVVLDRVARDPNALGSARKLVATIESLYPTLQLLEPAERVCNIGAILWRNVGSSASEGDQFGSWISLVPIGRVQQILQAPAPDADLHFTTYPNENDSECEAGNEPYAPGQFIGNPPGNQPTTTDATAPPKSATAHARAAGLLDRVEGARR